MPSGPELVIGLVGALGCDLPLVADVFASALNEVDYTAFQIRVSHLLHSLEPYSHLASLHDQQTYIEEHMNAGDDLRKRTTNDVMARLAIARVRAFRHVEGEIDSDNKPRPRTAYILTSLKRPEEVTRLREVYGDSFLLVSAYASRERRRDALASRIARSKNVEAHETIWIAEKLIERDEQDRAATASGQDVRDTFPLADAFVDAGDRAAIEKSVRRIVAVLFAHPFETPTIDEISMQHAYTAALRSADLSRQVGYAACTDDGQVLAVGTNEVAKAGGGFYWPGSVGDGRDFQVVESDEPNAEMKLAILRDLLERLRDEKIVALEGEISDELVSKIAARLRGTRFAAITEYGRAVHAEMSVITDAARRGLSLQNATMYGTTFPCHNCAKHVVAAGVKRLVYIEPYPKSQVERLFRDSIALETPAPGKVPFEPFVGIAPLRFREFFSMPRRKDENGRIISWDNVKRSSVPSINADSQAYVRSERVVIQELGKSLAEAGVRIQGTAKKATSENNERSR
jgi:deoxycytidylate deaminase